MSNMKNSESSSAVEIPASSLSKEALRGVIEAFVLQEGTDYGHRDYDLAEKVDHVMRQLERGKASVVFDPETQTCSIRTTGSI